MNPKSREFKALQNKWYKKLEKSGFEDAEQGDGNLKRWHSHDLTVFKARRESQTELFRLAGMFLHEYKFESPHDRLVWSLFSEGKVVPEILKSLKATKKPSSRTQVFLLLQTLTKKMLEFYGVR